ncbi:MAG: GH3 auxin-responsive promoter family protein [Acidobacteria bacterium]|nr:GH3 auxin-responsive promoter family protein [Acidobacteriota bacterium]MBI3423597.1 GH3 auxin-responsive promoter family protein [Acidobacteriota bacterium]
MLTRLVANGLWLASCGPEALQLRLAQRDPARAQRQLLLRYLRRNTDTSFGQQHDFASIHSVAEYQARVPLSTYEDYATHLAAISAGQQAVLTRAPVLLLEPTSGSSAATKLIPYTAELKHEFQRALAAWLCDLHWHEPRLLGGQAYWSVSPVTQRAAHTAGGVPIGFEDDSAYLGGWQRRLAQAVLAVPSCVRLIEEMEAFRYVTLLFLLRTRALALISVWNPTFLTLLVEGLGAWRQALVEDIARGTLSVALAADVRAELQTALRPAPKRAAEISAAFQASRTSAELHTRLWPRLRVLSCWADAQAAPYAEALARVFPHARLQGKGLLATEGFVSFPTWNQAGALLALRSHFFEFLPADAATGACQTAQPRLAHELEAGRCYAVVLTTSGGLYRYQLQDLVEVAGHQGQSPRLRFVGRAAQVSDWFGEKLNERHVSPALTEVLARLSLQPTFTLLACETTLQPPAYTLYIEIDAAAAMLRALAEALETALQENFHYRYCRDLGQLGALRVFRIRGQGADAYLANCQAHGQRAGDIKPALLQRRAGWAQVFDGAFLA